MNDNQKIAQMLGWEVREVAVGFVVTSGKEIELYPRWLRTEPEAWASIDLTSPDAVEQMKRYVEGKGYEEWNAARINQLYIVDIYSKSDENNVKTMISSDWHSTEAEAWKAVLLQLAEGEEK